MKILVERIPLKITIPDNFLKMETREKIFWIMKLTGLDKHEIAEWQELENG